MRTKFDQQLQQLNDEMIKLGTTIEKNIQESVDALVKQDVALATKVMERDAIVDRMQRNIESICFNLLIQQQPVARDLRAITAALKMVTDMERIGDHAADISEITVLLSGQDYRMRLDTITNMAGEAMEMLIKSVDAFTQRDEKLADWVIEHDDVVDSLFVKEKMELISLIKNESERGEMEIDMLMIAKYLERIADHATNIAEWVLYSLDNRIKE